MIFFPFFLLSTLLSMHEYEREREFLREYSAGYSLYCLPRTGATAACWALSERLADHSAACRALHAPSATHRPSPIAHRPSPIRTSARRRRRCKGRQRGPSGAAAGGAGGGGRGEPISAARRGGGRGEGRAAPAGEAEREGREREEATGSMLS